MGDRRQAAVLLMLLLVGAACVGPRRATQEGFASFYADPHHGQIAASGERYDMQSLSAAHPSLPFGTRVRVTCPGTGRSVVVVINDRGPFLKGRIIDLSLAAARQLGIVRQGVAAVRLEVLNRCGD